MEREMSKKTRKGYAGKKDAATDRAYQDEIEGKELTDAQQRNLALDRALGGDKDTMDKTEKTWTHKSMEEGFDPEEVKRDLDELEKSRKSYPSTRESFLGDARFIDKGISGRGDQSGHITRSEAVDETEVPMTYKNKKK